MRFFTRNKCLNSVLMVIYLLRCLTLFNENIGKRQINAHLNIQMGENTVS